MKQNCILERECAANEQYSRWECLEISGISDSSIPNNNLEETVRKILNETGVTVSTVSNSNSKCISDISWTLQCTKLYFKITMIEVSI